MGRSTRFGFGIVGVVLIVVGFAAFVHYRTRNLPTPEQINDKELKLNAERLRDLPLARGLPAIEPMKVEQALILEQIADLVPGYREASKPFHPHDKASEFPPEMDYRVEYSDEKDKQVLLGIAEVQQFPNEAWPLYFAKWSPNPSLLPGGNPARVLARTGKFKNQVVMDRQFRSEDHSGMLLFFWPSGKNLVSVAYPSEIIEEELLRRYLEKYPSSLH